MKNKTCKDIFSKHHGDPQVGYTYQEALIKRAKVNEAHGVGTPTSKWNGAVIELDPEKKSGYRVVIQTKE